MLLTIVILTCLLAYKLTGCGAIFKTIQNKPLADTIFLTIFFVFLLIPMSRINMSDISLQENRTLAKWQPLINENHKINFEFGKNFNDWFNDRFRLRNLFISSNHHIRFNLSNTIYKEPPRYFNKNSYWTFNTDWVSIKSDGKNFTQIINNIDLLKNFCDRNNIKLYILLAPTTSEVYDKEFTQTTGIKRIINNGEDFVKYTDDSTDFVISPLNELKAAKPYNPYTKGDVHWNHYGAYIAYLKLMQRIKTDFPDIQVLNKDAFKITKSMYSKTDYDNYPTNGNLYKELQIPDKYLDTEYYYFTYKKQSNIQTTKSNVSDVKTYNNNYTNKYSAYMIGDSYEENLSDFIIPTFHKVIKRRYNNSGSKALRFSKFKDDIIKEKPDILIITIVSFELSKLKDMFKGEN